jgi:hypothetical protein
MALPGYRFVGQSARHLHLIQKPEPTQDILTIRQAKVFA